MVASIRTKPGRTDEIIDGLTDILPDTRAFAGCNRLDVVQDVDDPTRIALIEEWDSKEQFAAYRAWRAETGTGLARWADALAEPPAIRVYEQRRDIHWG
jgi:quinol monooxygenase YgiN